MKVLLQVLALGILALPTFAAETDTAKERVATVCAACHGMNGVSVADHIPNLAGQRAAYLTNQLESFRDGSRKSDIMKPIAEQLDGAELARLATHFSALPPAPSSAKSALLDTTSRTNVTLPSSFERGFKLYLVKNDADGKVVTHYYASNVAFAAAATGKPLPDGSGIYLVTYEAKLDADGNPTKGSDGNFIPNQVRSYTAMAREAGWGRDVPSVLRNENWNYAVFDAKREIRKSVNQAECLACHKPKAASSYLFLLNELTAAARK